MLMTIWKKRYFGTFCLNGGKRKAKCHLNSFPCDKLKGGAKISASIQSHLLKMTGINLCEAGQSLFMKLHFLLSRLIKTIHYRRKIMGKSYTYSWCNSGKQYKMGLCKYSTVQPKILFKKFYVIKQRTL